MVFLVDPFPKDRVSIFLTILELGHPNCVIETHRLNFHLLREWVDKEYHSFYKGWLTTTRSNPLSVQMSPAIDEGRDYLITGEEWGQRKGHSNCVIETHRLNFHLLLSESD